MFLMFLIVFLYNFFSPNLQSIGKIELNYDANSLSVHWTGCTECTEQVQGSQPTQHHHLRCCCVETHSHPKSLKNLLWTILIVILEGFSLTDNNANFNVYFVRWSSVQSDEICSWCWLIITINDLYNIKIDNIRPSQGPAQTGDAADKLKLRSSQFSSHTWGLHSRHSTPLRHILTRLNKISTSQAVWH